MSKMEGSVYMRRIVLLLAVMGALLVVGFAVAQAQDPEQPNEGRQEFEDVPFELCSGEIVLIDGFATFNTEQREDKAGGTHAHTNLSLHGQGETEDGDRVILNSGSQSAGNFRPGSSNEGTFVSPATVTVQGEDGTRDDLVAHVTFHVTTNANGELTAEVLRIEADCR